MERLITVQGWCLISWCQLSFQAAWSKMPQPFARVYTDDMALRWVWYRKASCEGLFTQMITSIILNVYATLTTNARLSLFSNVSTLLSFLSFFFITLEAVLCVVSIMVCKGSGLFWPVYGVSYCGWFFFLFFREHVTDERKWLLSPWVLMPTQVKRLMSVLQSHVSISLKIIFDIDFVVCWDKTLCGELCNSSSKVVEYVFWDYLERCKL